MGFTTVGGVVLPQVNFFVLVVLALFALWCSYFLFRKIAPRHLTFVRFQSRPVDGLSLQPGPTQSGTQPITFTFGRNVGGVVLPAVNYLVLGILALFVLGVGFFLFRKRGSVIRFLTPMLTRLTRI